MNFNDEYFFQSNSQNFNFNSARFLVFFSFSKPALVANSMETLEKQKRDSPTRFASVKWFAKSWSSRVKALEKTVMLLLSPELISCLTDSDGEEGGKIYVYGK